MKKCALDNQILDEHGIQLTPKDLRAAYAEIAFNYFAPPTITKLAFFHQVLGHSPTEDTSAMSYLRFYLNGRLGDAIAHNERAKRDLAIATYAERNALTNDDDRRLRDTRIAAVESTLGFTSRTIIAGTAGTPIDPAIAQHAQLVHTQAATLTTPGATRARPRQR
jgi:hypothetical protein